MLKILEAWNMNKWNDGDLQDMINVYLHLQNKGLEFDSVLRQYMEYRRYKKAHDIFVYKRCPECDNPMRLSPVNTSPGNQVGGDWQSQWFCGCGHDILSMKNTNDEMTENLKKRVDDREQKGSKKE